MLELELKILEIVQRNNGCFSWYQLDRVLSETGSHHGGRLMHILDSLVDSGRICMRPGPNPVQPFYEITEMGLEAIKESSELKTETAGQ